MNIAYHSHRRTNVHDIAFHHQQFLRPLAYFFQNCINQQLLVKQLLYACVQVERHHGTRQTREAAKSRSVSRTVLRPAV